MKKRFLYAICLFLLLFCGVTVHAEEPEIKVFVDGEQIEFDVPPEIKNDRVMVPIRAFFEHLGAKVEWIPSHKIKMSETSSITVPDTTRIDVGTFTLRMEFNQDRVYAERTSEDVYSANTREIRFDVEPYIKNGRTLYPLRALAEASYTDVEWDEAEKSVYITTGYPKAEYMPMQSAFNPACVQIGNAVDGYMQASLAGNTIEVTGRLKDKEIKKVGIHYGKNVVDIVKVQPDGSFRLVSNIPKSFSADENWVTLYCLKQGKIYSELSSPLFLEKQEETYRLKKPDDYEKQSAEANKWRNPVFFKQNGSAEEIKELSDEICKDATNDYEKAYQIHRWVAENIAYHDVDGHTHREYLEQNIHINTILKDKEAVCYGYAVLVQALLDEQGIPCRVVFGYAGELSVPENEQYANHVWNTAYVDNRWINMDATWDAEKVVEDGRVEENERHVLSYFDIAEPMFFQTHHVLYYDRLQ